ncbi:hypothetical protein B7463_g5824, partial [Scytalidium lignicola]
MDANVNGDSAADPSEHVEGIKPLADSGSVVVGGAMLHSHSAPGDIPPFKGSALIVVAEDEREVKELLSKDIYARNEVWDVEKMQIIPFMCALRIGDRPLVWYTRKRTSAVAPEKLKSTTLSQGAHGVQIPPTAPEEFSPPAQTPSLLRSPSPQTTARLIDWNVRDRHGQSEGPEMLYTRLVESGPSKDPPGSFPDNARSYYMGDSFSLAFIVRSLSGGSDLSSGPKLHCPIPNTVAEHGLNAAESRKDSDPVARAYLQMHGALNLPPQEVRDQLVYMFFKCVHPAFPVFDRQEFCALYQQNRASLLILQTIFFLSSVICGEDILKAAGFIDRYSARRTFYLRAKALYDMDCEKNKPKLVAVLLLLGFWWEGPEDQKDTWHWLGAAISLAQTLGMHRSTANSRMSPRQRSMWKRIWWSIYVRDRHATAALGRPCRINDEDCDVEMLVVEDFLFDQESDSRLVCVQQPYHQSYAIEMAKLTVILGKLLNYKFTPRKIGTKNISTDTLGEELDQWQMNLSADIRPAPLQETLDAPFWSCMVHACFYLCQILLFRPNNSNPRSHQPTSFQRKARIAADCVTRIVEDLLSSRTLALGQLHLVPTIFAALSIHTLVIRGGDSIQKQLAENRARQCILGMSELAKGWPVAGWVLRLFINLMRRLTGQSEAYGSSLDQRRERNLSVNQDVVQPPSMNGTNLTSFLSVNIDECVTANNGSIGDQVGNGFDLLQTDQFMADIMWADQNDLDFDIMLKSAQSKSLFPFNLD